MLVSVTSVHEVACAHLLPYYEGKCNRLHGHNYVLKFTRFGAIQEGNEHDSGMVMDFSEMDAMIKAVLVKVDHFSLNTDCGIGNPTAENFGLWLMSKLPFIDKIEVHETGRHYVTIEREPHELIPEIPPYEE